MPGSRLIHRIQEITSRAGFTAVAVSFYDYESTVHFSYQGDRYFHSASTIKVPFLLGVFKAAEAGQLKLDSRLHVRNRFHSVIGASVFRLDPERDGDPALYQKRGHAIPILELARAMIVRSSNLATNVLFDFVGLETIRSMLGECALTGIKVERGVEDEAAYAQGLNNEVTADGLLQCFRLLVEKKCFREESCTQMIEILLAQEFNQMIPKRLPPNARTAHKTGEISTACHDAGIVYLPDRNPYVVAILTEGPADQSSRQKAVAGISSAIFHYLTEATKRDE